MRSVRQRPLLARSFACKEIPFGYTGGTSEVVFVTPARSEVLVHHDEIPSYMPSMTMEFLVAPANLA